MAIMMDLRQAVMHKMEGHDHEGLRKMIEGSIDAQEAALPGLGVVFEILWKNVSTAKQDRVIDLLERTLKEANEDHHKK